MCHESQVWKSHCWTSSGLVSQKAQEALQKLQNMTFTDEQIDALLPRELKRSSAAREVLDRELERIIRPTDSGTSNK
jgi:hypothetical protein